VFGIVVVGFDGSDSARDALALGEVLTEPSRADLVVARVYPWDPAGAPKAASFAELDRVAGAVGGRPALIASDAPAPGLQDLAAELGADLLVVGSGIGDTHRTAAGRVSRQVNGGSPCPVAIAPRGFARRYAPDIRTIAVGYDGSAEAKAALSKVAELARALRARVRVIAVCPGGERPPGKLGDRLADALASLPGEIECGGVIRSGEPALALLEEAREADLLVVGSRRHGPSRRVLLGSVSAELVRQARCPLMVSPRDTGHAPSSHAVARG
jgi:nucleotide-binding universal stress UspA family protein